MQEENTGYHRGTKWRNPWDKRESSSGEMRQWDLGQGQMLDPVVDIRDTGGMAVVATTRWVQVAYMFGCVSLFVFVFIVILLLVGMEQLYRNPCVSVYVSPVLCDLLICILKCAGLVVCSTSHSLAKCKG